MVRLGIIGMGHMGRGHAEYLLKGIIKDCELVAVCDIVRPHDEIYKDLKYYSDYKELIDSGDVDAVIVATPHYSHTYIAAYALEHNIHTICEKPISVHKKDCLKLISSHKNKNIVFSAMFNQRTRPAHVKMKELIPKIGNIQRMTCLCTDWYRTQAYYNSSDWRATWKGEGGGVLMNQTPHQLDLIQWLTGMPKYVTAHLTFGKYHDIEVEDEVNAMFEYENGAIGTFTGSTCEYPGTNLLDIVGEKGKLSFENETLKVWLNDVSSVDFSYNDVKRAEKEKKENKKVSYRKTPKCEYKEYTFDDRADYHIQHSRITQNFVNAIEYGEPLTAPAEEGIKSVELANAILMSGILNEKVELPIDPDIYEIMLNNLKTMH